MGVRLWKKIQWMFHSLGVQLKLLPAELSPAEPGRCVSPLFPFIVAFLVGVAAPTDSEAGVFFVGLGGVDPSVESAALSISGDGRTIVGYKRVGGGNVAVVWTLGNRGIGAAIECGKDSPDSRKCSLDAVGHGVARDVSSDGSVVVGDGVVWTRDDGLLSLGLGRAFAVSDDGSTVVGEERYSNNPITGEAYQYSSDSGTVLLGGFAEGNSYSVAYGVSSDGSYVVGAGSTTVGSEAFIWTADEGMTGLGHLSCSPEFSVAQSISGDGRVVVGGTQCGGFIWSAESGIAPLQMDFAFDTNQDGSAVVGWSNREAMLWTEAGGLLNLHDFAQDFAAGTEGWTLTRAYGVSADGRRIVGEGINPDGVTEAFLLILQVPEPRMVWLIGFGVLGLGLISRRQQWKLHSQC